MHSDIVLVIGIKQGKQSHMTELVERYYDPLLAYLFRMCGGHQVLAEDLVQETFLRMMRGIESYDIARPFKPWLYAIATNIVRNHYNLADTRYTQNTIEDALYEDKSQLPEAQLIQQQSEQAITQALANLPDHQREVIVLYYYQELSQKEIADSLNIPLGTVKSRLSIGIKRLRQIMQDEGTK